MATVAVLLAVATRPAAAACTGDLDDSGQVDVVDMLDLLAQWGQPGVTDLDGDGDTSVTDLLQLLASWGVCPDATNVIVVYNVNSPDADGNGASDALEIAQYYATARGLDSSVLCPVELPPGQYATPDELLSARRTILEDCICALSPPEVQQATGCSIDGPGNIEAISDGSPITHMVLIRGLPARLFDTGWPNAADSDKKGPSFDYYLSYLLNHDEDIFPNNLQLSLPLYAPTSTAYGYQPPLDPGEHGMLAYGRVEAITKQRTFDLIDRTLAAEAAGVKGSFLLESSEPALYDMTATFDDACFDYLSHEPFVFGDPANSWPYAQCRVGSTDSTSAGSNPGEIPGEPNTTIPFAIDAGFFYGEIAVINRFKAFDGFDNMLNWHRAVEDCVELCKDCDGDNGCDQATCFANSTDYLGEINTDCVGVSPGFIAFQNSSFAVQQYGFWPPGWVTARGSAHDRSVPRVVQGDAFDDGMQFTDDLYVHYGAFDHLTPDASTCADVGTCAEHIAVNLALYQDIPDIPLDGAERQFTMRFRYRYDPPAGLANPKLKTRLRFTLLDGGGGSSTTDSPLITITIPPTNGAWVETSDQYSIGPFPGMTIDAVRLLLWNDASAGVRGSLDFDAFEIIDDTTAQSLLDDDDASFTTQGHERNIQGDWAFNVIDRLGGVACWGAMSHHSGPASGGAFPGAFFSGRTFGEAVQVTPNVMVYGDPLYQPSAAKIYVTSHLPIYQGDEIGNPNGYDVWSDTQEFINLRINAWHGTANESTTNWELSICDGMGIDACDGRWVVAQQGVGAARDLDVGYLGDYIDTQLAQDVTLRLRVWNTGDEANDLSNYAYFSYANYPLPDCPGDYNADGQVNELDETELLSYWGPNWFCEPMANCPIIGGFCVADLNQDGLVNVLDLILMLQSQGDCGVPFCFGDMTGDGIVNGLDIDFLYLYWTADGEPCPKPYEDCPIDESTGFCVFDFDQDGDVDNLDHLTLLSLFGPCPL